MEPQPDSIVKADIERLAPLIEAALMAPLGGGEAPVLREAMAYSLKAGGKRVRPILCLLAAESLGKPAMCALACGVALEYVHTYSLIHDDLPAMDDDDLRRGKPTNHKVYGEGQAILAGDGLLTEAFGVLARDASLSPGQKADATDVLSLAAGWRGMVGGQSLDLEGEKLAGHDYAHLQLIHRLKTGALLRASLEMGAIAAGADDGARKALREAGAALGLAFQIQDDILDATSTTEAMGKRVGKDQGKGKVTYPILLGLDNARKALSEATDSAISLLGAVPSPQSLTAWAQYLCERAK